MAKAIDKRQALQREALRVKSALDDFADLAAPKKRKPESSNHDVFQSGVIATVNRFSSAPKPDAVMAASDDFFNDFDPPMESNYDSRSNIESQDNIGLQSNFSPGVGEDFAEGFESETNIPAKSGQDTLSVPVMSAMDNTPANGTPRPNEAINDILDGFEW